MRLCLWFSLLLVLLSSNAFGGVLFKTEWESKPGTPWAYTGGSPYVDCAVPSSPSGGCALRFDYAAGTYPTSFGAGRATVNFEPVYNEMWIGHWSRYSSGFVWHPSGTKMDLLYLKDKGQFNRQGNIAVGWKGSASAPHSVASNQIAWGPRTQDFHSGYVVPTNTWFWVEEHFVINTPGQSNGVYEFYVNDTLQLRTTNVPYRDSSVTRAWGEFQHSAEWGGGGGTVPAKQYWWVDHTVISTTRIGRPGSGSVPTDSTPPVPPSGITVR